jgi:hypothetical protein
MLPACGRGVYPGIAPTAVGIQFEVQTSAVRVPVNLRPARSAGFRPAELLSRAPVAMDRNGGSYSDSIR